MRNARSPSSGRNLAATAKPRHGRKARAQAIIAHIEAAQARQSGTDITHLSDDELIVDLMRHRVGA